MTRDLSSELATGMLQTIDNQIDQTTGTVRLKAVFDNKDRALWPNQFVNARLLLDTQRDAIVIPSAAIQTGSQGTFVYRGEAGQTVDVRPVTVARHRRKYLLDLQRPYARRAGGNRWARPAASGRYGRCAHRTRVAQAQAAARNGCEYRQIADWAADRVVHPWKRAGERGQFGGQNGGQRNHQQAVSARPSDDSSRGYRRRERQSITNIHSPAGRHHAC